MKDRIYAIGISDPGHWMAAENMFAIRFFSIMMVLTKTILHIQKINLIVFTSSRLGFQLRHSHFHDQQELFH